MSLVRGMDNRYTCVMGNDASGGSDGLDLYTAPWVDLKLIYRVSLVEKKVKL